jgi:nitric oxide reductase NorE protein
MTNVVLFDAINNVPVSEKTSAHKLPGDIAMWVFIVMELSVFAIFLLLLP